MRAILAPSFFPWRRGPTPAATFADASPRIHSPRLGMAAGALTNGECDALFRARARQAIADDDFELVLTRRKRLERHRLTGERLRLPRRRRRQVGVGHVLRRR